MRLLYLNPLAQMGGAERALLEKVATRLAGLVLIGWDTRGQPWDP